MSAAPRLAQIQKPRLWLFLLLSLLAHGLLLPLFLNDPRQAILPAYGDKHVNVVVSVGPVTTTQAGPPTPAEKTPELTAIKPANHTNRFPIADKQASPSEESVVAPHTPRQTTVADTRPVTRSTPTLRPAPTPEKSITPGPTTATAKTADTSTLPNPQQQAGTEKASETKLAATTARRTSDTPQTDEQAASEHRRFIIGRIEHLLSQHLIYPRLAQRRGWEGEVTLSFRLQADGRIENIAVARTSGYGILDTAAEKGLRHLRRIDEAASWLQGQALDLEVPVHYKLVKS